MLMTSARSSIKGTFRGLESWSQVWCEWNMKMDSVMWSDVNWSQFSQCHTWRWRSDSSNHHHINGSVRSYPSARLALLHPPSPPVRSGPLRAHSTITPTDWRFGPVRREVRPGPGGSVLVRSWCRRPSVRPVLLLLLLLQLRVCCLNRGSILPVCVCVCVCVCGGRCSLSLNTHTRTRSHMHGSLHSAEWSPTAPPGDTHTHTHTARTKTIDLTVINTGKDGAFRCSGTWRVGSDVTGVGVVYIMKLCNPKWTFNVSHYI